jgi:CRISPR/Cas system-associated exonuclease Cas4 (RecB family)
VSQYYQARRTRNVFDPQSEAPFVVSRSKIDLFLDCPRCFYLDRRLGVGRPPGYPFNLNSAVDTLLKKEFDTHRAAGTPHPLMSAYGLVAVPYQHKDLSTWRENFEGVRVAHAPTNFTVTGAVDDVWVTPAGELIVVDYKSTAKNGDVSIDAPWQISYKRQMEVYQWLLRQLEFTVSPTGYFVYANGQTDRQAFDGKLEFVVKLLPYTGDDRWVEETLQNMRACLLEEVMPAPDADCDYCAYREAAQSFEVSRSV